MCKPNRDTKTQSDVSGTLQIPGTMKATLPLYSFTGIIVVLELEVAHVLG